MSEVTKSSEQVSQGGQTIGGQTIVVNQQSQNSNGVGTAGFVLALITLFLCWVPILNWILWGLGLILSFVGVFFKPRGLAIAGLVISLIALIIIIAVIATLAAGLAGIFS